jgi:hypothetical protein
VTNRRANQFAVCTSRQRGDAKAAENRRAGKFISSAGPTYCDP